MTTSTTNTSSPTTTKTKDPYSYIPGGILSGSSASIQSEALPNALPDLGNTPQVCPYGLIAEQLNGTSFTAPRDSNQRSYFPSTFLFFSWLYRISPCVVHKPLAPSKLVSAKSSFSIPDNPAVSVPNQLRWKPLPIDETKTWATGLVAYAGSGVPSLKAGLVAYLYTCGKNMSDEKQAFCNADGDMLIVPQQGTLDVTTEFGKLWVTPGEFCVIQRGIRFSIDLPDGPSRGYICEVYDSHFVLPSLGPIGANGLANPRDFLSPTAHYVDKEEKWTIIQKFDSLYFDMESPLNPYNVVAWHGNYVPYKYDTAKFCVINSVSFDHLDPCIFVCISAQTAVAGTAVCDFVIFTERNSIHGFGKKSWHTFRPPYYHRNTMAEFMGTVYGKYEAKAEGFQATLHNTMIPHGPDQACFESAITEEQIPVKTSENALAFMFETNYIYQVSKWLTEDKELVDQSYNEQAWTKPGIPRTFNPNKRNMTNDDVKAAIAANKS